MLGVELQINLKRSVSLSLDARYVQASGKGELIRNVRRAHRQKFKSVIVITDVLYNDIPKFAVTRAPLCRRFAKITLMESRN